MYICEKCNKSFEKKHAYIGHCSVHNRIKKPKPEKNNEHICKFCGEKFKTGPKLGTHVRNCKKHPNYKERIEKISKSHLGKTLSKEHKNSVSNGMKLAHKEGRAWNIGMSRWNNESSYPEEFFMKVIENEFEDKKYQKEYPVGIYSLDFAWVEKKKVIEIDGEQHQRFEEYQQRDKRKDKYLQKNGWKVLRISWKDMYHNTKEEIKKCKEFINK